MFPTNNLNPLIRYPLAVLAALLATAFFLTILIAALKLGEILLG